VGVSVGLTELVKLNNSSQVVWIFLLNFWVLDKSMTLGFILILGGIQPITTGIIPEIIVRTYFEC